MTGDEPIAPEGFDLAEAKRAPSTTPEEDRQQCPDCGAISLSARTGKNGTASAEYDKHCDVCCAKHEEADLHE